MDADSALTTAERLSGASPETLLAFAVIVLAGAVAALFWRVVQRARGAQKYERESHGASVSYYQELIARLMDENGRHALAGMELAKVLDRLDERIERLERRP